MLKPVDLLDDFASLCDLCTRELAREHWLDAYLLAAGANQIVEDYLHPDPLAWQRLGRHVADLPKVGRPAAAVYRKVDRTAFELGWRRKQQWVRWQQQWTSHVVAPLAGRVVGAGMAPSMAIATVLAADSRSAPPSLRQALLRLPSCFQSFDQQLPDIDCLVRKFADQFPDRARPLTVVGVRSSGSYLAPLAEAFFRAAGFTDVAQLTLRPGRWLHSAERLSIAGARDRDGLVVLLDDPPATGRALASVAEALRSSLGLPLANIVLLLAAFEANQQLPVALADYQSIVLPWPEWAVHDQLEPAAALATLSELLRPAGEVTSVERLPLSDRSWTRGHIRAQFSVQLRSPSSSVEQRRDVYAEGVGLGYFGQHALAVAERLTDFVPHIYGLRAGLLFREWLPTDARLAASEPASDEDWQFAADGIATYVARRRLTLQLAEDKSLRLRGRDPVWEIAGYIVEKSFGRRGARLIRPLIHTAVRRLLQVNQPVLVDGATERGYWFRRNSPPGVLKVGFAQRDFSNLDTVSCDPVYDLAGAEDTCQAPRFGFALRRAYERRTGEPVDAERWLLYQLVQREASLRTRADRVFEVREASGRALRAYYAETLFGPGAKNPPPLARGQLCAIDIDGVLETEGLGFLAPTPAAAIGIRSLTCHGYRPVVVTGRSLDEVIERCWAYGLVGGVAEYGAVVYDHIRRQVTDVISDAARVDLERVRVALGEVDGVELDNRYRRAVRAYRLTPGGTRRALAPEVASAMLARAGVDGRVMVIHGQDQTDFMGVGIDKGVGVQALIEAFSVAEAESNRVLALAIGDTASDLPMLVLAERAFAPANADAALRRARVSITRGAYQLGFLEAVSWLLQHRPGGCSVCQVPKLSDRTRLLLTLLGAQDRPRWGKLFATAEVAWRLTRQGRRVTPWANRSVPSASPRNT